MEKFLLPAGKTNGKDKKKALRESNSPLESSQEVVHFHEVLIKQTKLQPSNSNEIQESRVKHKKNKEKRNRGKKRKLLDKHDIQKMKRKKGEEKPSETSDVKSADEIVIVHESKLLVNKDREQPPNNAQVQLTQIKHKKSKKKKMKKERRKIFHQDLMKMNKTKKEEKPQEELMNEKSDVEVVAIRENEVLSQTQPHFVSTAQEIKMKQKKIKKRKLLDRNDLPKVKKRKEDEKPLEQTKFDEEVVVIHEQLLKHTKPPPINIAQAPDNQIQCKKLKTKKIKMEKVKHLGTDMKKLKKKTEIEKTGEETISSSADKVPVCENNEATIDVSDKQEKEKHSRKNKVILKKCRETFEVLTELGVEVLQSVSKSLNLVKSYNLLNEKFMSVEILLDLISLALERRKDCEGLDVEKEVSLMVIARKCFFKKSEKKKVEQSLVPNAAKSLTEEKEQPSTSTSKEGTVDLEETLETTETNTEPAVEKPAKNCITKYFKKLEKTVEEGDKNERFRCFTTKTDMFLAPKLGKELTGENRLRFEEELKWQNSKRNYLTENGLGKSSEVDPEGRISGGKRRKEGRGVSLAKKDKPKTGEVARMKAKLLQFHDNRRPPYWGTWRRKSESVGGRKPFGKDNVFNYNVDSDEDWEEEEAGESLHGSEDEKEPEEDYEVDNEFFVPHGYLSDDENPEKENLSPNTKLDLLKKKLTSERKQKTKKMTPIVFGPFWVNDGIPKEGTLYHDLQIERLKYVPWTKVPVQIVPTEKQKKKEEIGSQAKKPKLKIFPPEEVPKLIGMIHGSPESSGQLAKKFLEYWDSEKSPGGGTRASLTKICVQKKIKELATWQSSLERGKMCWQVPRGTIEEFGAVVVRKTPEKKPQKCFIWKFVRREGKRSGEGAKNRKPEVVMLES